MTIFGFVLAKKAEHSISIMCRVLEVSRSGYHAWVGRSPSARAVQDARLSARIAVLHKLRRGVYGSPRIWADLVLDDGERLGRKRVERLMREAGLSGLITKKWKATTIRIPGVRVADDLLDRDFTAGGPNQRWVADITYLRTWQGWLYLVAVQDLYSRRIVGWAMADHIRAELVVDALQMALARRRPAPGLIWHSDQGSQFVSLAFGQQARAAGIAQSMGSRGLLRQRRRGELLRDDQEGAHPPPCLADQGRATDRGVRLHRNLLQPPTPPLDARPALAGRVRDQHSQPGRC